MPSGRYHVLLGLSKRELVKLVLQREGTISGLKTNGAKLRQHIKDLEEILQNVRNN